MMTFKCRFCAKSYPHGSSKSRHEKTCLEDKPIDKRTREYKDSLSPAPLNPPITSGRSSSSSPINNVTYIQNVAQQTNITNQQNNYLQVGGRPKYNIRINDLSTPLMDYVKDLMVKLTEEAHKSFLDDEEDRATGGGLWVRKSSEIVSTLHQELYWNSDHPENASIRAKSARKKKEVEIEFWEKGRWIRVTDKETFYNNLHEIHVRRICQMFEMIVKEINDLEVVNPNPSIDALVWYLHHRKDRRLLTEQEGDLSDDICYFDDISKKKMEKIDAAKGLEENFTDAKSASQTETQCSDNVDKILKEKRERGLLLLENTKVLNLESSEKGKEKAPVIEEI